MYADYDFYIREYKGAKIQQADFDGLERRAEFELDYMTNGNITEASLEAYKLNIGLATCAVCEALQAIDKFEVERPLQSVSSGGESYTYAGTPSKLEQASQSETGRRAYLWSVIRIYLTKTGLMYQGV